MPEDGWIQCSPIMGRPTTDWGGGGMGKGGYKCAGTKPGQRKEQRTTEVFQISNLYDGLSFQVLF
jgi:hypothetical protein